MSFLLALQSEDMFQNADNAENAGNIQRGEFYVLPW